MVCLQAIPPFTIPLQQMVLIPLSYQTDVPIQHQPSPFKTILRLYFFEQKNTIEIAELLQLSPQTVLNHKTKAIDALRKSGLRFKWLLDGVPGFVVAAAFYLLK